MTNFSFFFCAHGLAHVRVANDLRAGFSQLQLKSGRHCFLIFGYDQLPCLVSVLASLLEWVDFLLNRVLIFPERVLVHAFPHLRKSINSQVPATIISKVAYRFLFWPLLCWFLLLNNADTIAQFQIVACGLISLYDTGRMSLFFGVSTIFLVSSDVASDHFISNIQA